MTTIFGHSLDDLDDYALQIVIDNPGVRAWFEQNTQRNHILQRYHYDGSLRGKLMSLLRTASKIAGVGTAIYSSLSNLPSQRTPDTEPSSHLRKGGQGITMPKRLDMDQDEEMKQAVEMTAPMRTQALAATSRSAGTQTSGPLGSGETPIAKQRPHYGLPDTTTVILPWTQYFTPVTFADYKMVVLRFRMNTPYDCAERVLTSPTISTPLGEGVYSVQPPTTGTWPATLVTYPTNAAGTTTAEAPQWRDYYEKLYKRYTVLGCEFTLTLMNPREARSHDVAVAWGFDGSSASSADRVFPQERFSNEMEFWPGLKWEVVRSTNDATDDPVKVIKGYYRPGQAQTNTQNDEDVKTWSNVGSVPSLTETLTLFFGRAAMNGNINKLALKAKIQLKYIVQYKDPSPNVFYPHAGQTAFAINVPTDIRTLV